MLINGVEFENTFLVVRGVNLEVILGNDFLIKRRKAVVDFNKRLLELDNETKPVRVSFKQVIDNIRISGIRVVHHPDGKGDTEARVNVCREKEVDVSGERVWENRAGKFVNEGGVVGRPQREELWAVVDRFKEVFAELPGRARNYECELKVREHTPFVQRSYPVPFSKRRAVQIELDRMMEGGIIDVYKRQLL